METGFKIIEHNNHTMTKGDIIVYEGKKYRCVHCVTVTSGLFDEVLYRTKRFQGILDDHFSLTGWIFTVKLGGEKGRLTSYQTPSSWLSKAIALLEHHIRFTIKWNGEYSITRKEFRIV